MGEFDIAQICINGHSINDRYNSSKELRAEYCDKCGEKTIINCSNCNESIRGYYSIPGFIGFSEYLVPSFCHNCGKPYPWTESLLNNAVEIVALDDNLSDKQKEILRSSFPDLMLDTPTTPLSVAKYKKHISSAENYVRDSLQELLFKIVSDAVKKSLWG